jgi:hypothetical protein
MTLAWSRHEEGALSLQIESLALSNLGTAGLGHAADVSIESTISAEIITGYKKLHTSTIISLGFELLQDIRKTRLLIDRAMRLQLPLLVQRLRNHVEEAGGR